VSKRAFNSLDTYVWRLVYKWAKFSDPNKSKRWVTERYFGMFNPFRQDRWVFGDRASGFYLYKFAWTPIIRHRMVPGTASTDDPALVDFWAKRRRRSKPPLGKTTLRLLQKQGGRCPLCGGLLLHAGYEPQTPDQWEQWLRVTRAAIRKHAITTDAGNGTPDKPAAPRLIHTHCHRRLNTDTSQHF
jgi:RNA-directed DNA polymerase